MLDSNTMVVTTGMEKEMGSLISLTMLTPYTSCCRSIGVYQVKCETNSALSFLRVFATSKRKQLMCN